MIELVFLKIFDFESACLPGVWFEPVVSHSYYSPRRQLFTKSVQLYKLIQKNKSLSYNKVKREVGLALMAINIRKIVAHRAIKIDKNIKMVVSTLFHVETTIFLVN